jgi:glycosyltransferase involved in cell wall biosynthesis
VHILILGCRGVPAQHGGFETFAHDLSLYLVSRNHKVTVYCQSENHKEPREDTWNGVRRVLIPAGKGALGTIHFDWASVKHACKEKGVILTLGYNTGIFNFRLRGRNLPSVMNMDGIEWQRAKWSFPHRAWLWLNEIAGSYATDHLIADHPEISLHLERHTKSSKISVIPYGAHPLPEASLDPVTSLGLKPKEYFLVVARPEPDNSILEIVCAYSSKERDFPLVVLGKYAPITCQYQQTVLEAAGTGVRFLGAVYDRRIVEALRSHATAYVHGHRVGGTNPSLVESLAAGNAIIAHDNRFTRWVAGNGAHYFKEIGDLARIFDSIESDPGQLLAMEEASRQRHREDFLQDGVLSAYESLLLKVSRSADVEGAATGFSVSGIDGVGVLSANQWAYKNNRDDDDLAFARNPQRRAAVRYKLQFPVLIHWNDGSDHMERGFTSDVGLNGALIFSHSLPPVGCDVRIEVITPSPEKRGEELRIECFGKVARLVDHTDGSGFGVHGVFDHDYLNQMAWS